MNQELRAVEWVAVKYDQTTRWGTRFQHVLGMCQKRTWVNNLLAFALDFPFIPFHLCLVQPCVSFFLPFSSHLSALISLVGWWKFGVDSRGLGYNAAFGIEKQKKTCYFLYFCGYGIETSFQNSYEKIMTRTPFQPYPPERRKGRRRSSMEWKKDQKPIQ